MNNILMDSVNYEYSEAKIRKLSSNNNLMDLSEINIEYNESDSLIDRQQYL